VTLDALCDGGAYDNYNIEVVDRMGADSFCPDSGVMISKTKVSDRVQPFQWVIDANPEDARQIDFYLPNGTARYWTIGDYRQLVDALFHAGTNSGSEYEYIDEPNGLHFYLVDKLRDDAGVLHYTVGVASIAQNATIPAGYALDLSPGTVAPSGYGKSATDGTYCTFELENTGKPTNISSTSHPQDLSAYLGSDIYRLEAEVEGEGWKVAVPNALAYAKTGEKKSVQVAVGCEGECAKEAIVSLKVTSESDKDVERVETCKVTM
jgi:hypothetical protein